MDPSNDFSFITSTPMPTSIYLQSQKKRPLLKEKNNEISASPISKRTTPATAEETSNETMADLFDYDKKSTDGFSLEDGKENQQKKIDDIIHVTHSSLPESASPVSKSTTPVTVKGTSDETMSDLFDYDKKSADGFSFEKDEKDNQQGKANGIVHAMQEHLLEEKNNDISDSLTKKKPPVNAKGTSDETLSDIYYDEKSAHGSFEEDGKENQQKKALSIASEEISSHSASSQHTVKTTEEESCENTEIVEDSQSGTDNSVQIDEDESIIASQKTRAEKQDNERIPPVTSHLQNIPRTILIPQPTITSALPGRLFGGKMTDERFQKISSVSNDIINSMHSSLSTLPENVPTDSPNGLRLELLPHQKTGLTWLLWREQQIPPSGVLADDMGLGKTLAMVSLILHMKNLRKANSDEVLRIDRQLRRRHIDDIFLTPANSTLVVAPASLIFQWEKEVRDRVKNELKVHIFHGPKQKRDISVERLIKYDMVITTYDTLVSELKNRRANLVGVDDNDERVAGTSRGKRLSKKFFSAPSSVLSKIAWERIILDEAHEIRNKNSLKFNCCCSLEAVHRWCLTGTPIHNKLWDLFSLIHFLRIVPFSEEKMWKEFIMNSSAMSAQRLNVIVKSILLRRTKGQICMETNRPIVDLQPKNFELVTLNLHNLEQQCYSLMFEASKQKVRELLRDGALGGYGTRRFKRGAIVRNPFIGGGARMDVDDHFKAYSCILTLLLRLRQACVHLSLTKHAIDIDAFKQDNDEVDGDADKLVEKVLEMSMAQMSLDEDGLEGTEERRDLDETRHADIERLFTKEHKSTKVNALMERLNAIMGSGDKCVIVSQWTSMLAIIEFHLRQSSISFTSITGEVRTEERQFRVDAFNRAESGPNVMLLSLTAGGVGLNLTGGNHLFLIDLHWNPALELQASDRIHRLGQKKNVFIHKFVCTSTIEQRVLELQEKKKSMATSVLEGAAKKLGKLSKDDVMFLFELEKRPPNTQQNNGKSQKPTTSTQI